MERAEAGPLVGELELVEEVGRQGIRDRSQRIEDVAHDAAEEPRGHFAGRLIDGDDAAGVQGIVLVVVGVHNFVVGMEDGELAGVAIELDLAEERDAAAGGEDLIQVAALEPLAHQPALRPVDESGFEKGQIATLQAHHAGGAHLHHDGGHLAGGELRNRLQVAAIFVTEGGVGEQILDDA